MLLSVSVQCVSVSEQLFNTGFCLLFTPRRQTLWPGRSSVRSGIEARDRGEDGRWGPADGAGRRESWRLVHLGGGAEPQQQERPVAGHRSKGLQHQSVGPKAPGGVPCHQPLCWRGRHSKYVPCFCFCSCHVKIHNCFLWLWCWLVSGKTPDWL